MSATDPAVPRRSWLARVWAFVIELWDVLRRARQLPGLSRPAQLDRQDRAQDAGLQGSLGPSVRQHRYPRKIQRQPPRTGTARMGAVQGQRLAGMPQLPQLPVDGHHQAIAARIGGASALPVQWREDLHRLPQGHRPPSAGHARYSGLAIAAPPESVACAERTNG